MQIDIHIIIYHKTLRYDMIIIIQEMLFLSSSLILINHISVTQTIFSITTIRYCFQIHNNNTTFNNCNKRVTHLYRNTQHTQIRCVFIFGYKL